MRRRAFPAKSSFHHQGGPTGYGEREWVATPNGTEVVVNNQAFAWNPSIRGGKAGGHGDSARWRDRKPDRRRRNCRSSQATVEGSTYPAAGVLVK